VALLPAACGTDNPPPTPDGETEIITTPPLERPEGATDFVSADGRNGQESEENADETASGMAEDSDGSGGGERTVEEGDIYRVLGDSLILNLNAYRGLQIIDFSDVENPEIVGRLQISGTPVELYAVGDRAYVLMNNWRGYYGSRYGSTTETRQGGVVLSVDISDPTNPRRIDQAYIPGWIRTSRLTRGGDSAALYAVTGGWAQWEEEDGSWVWESRTVVMSYDISDGILVKRTELNLGGYVADIQATPNALMVARNDWSYENGSTQLSLIDISDPQGTMVEGDSVAIAGWIRNQFNMDLYNGVLRVVSGNSWRNGDTNFLQTFDATDYNNLTLIDEVTFGDNQSLFATLFLGNKAFFVTYRRTDPFHAFRIDDDGFATEMNEFIVSGWNDFFRPVINETRLLGIGINDEGGRTLAVSLYDITDLTNPEPLVARAQVESDRSWSEANWDHRAFSILEDVVEIEGPDGELETGLVLLPFQGYNSDWEQYTAGVQIFSFSESSLTRRGMMNHGTPVRRTFPADDDTTANLSEAQLSLFDATDPENPEELGRVDLAPNYTEYFLFGDYGARVRNSRDYYYYWWSSDTELPPSTVDIIVNDDNPDLGEAVASFEIPSNAVVHQAGDMLVAVEMRATDTSEWPYVYESDIIVWDLSDPRNPVLAAELTTDRLQPSYGYYDYGYYGGGMVESDCFDCGGYYGYWGGSAHDVEAVDGALVFLQRHNERELLGHEEICNTYPNEYEDCWDYDGEREDDDCTYYSGSVQCRSLDGADPVCTGAIVECSADDGEYACHEIDADRIHTNEYCWDYDRYRYWQWFSFEILDLSAPADARFADSIELPVENQGVSFLADRTDLWVTFTRPVVVADDSRSYLRYFIERIDLSTPSAPIESSPINVPGELLAVDGNTIYTRDTLWGDEIVESAVARLELLGGLAYLQAWRSFPDEQVFTIMLDGAGHLLVSHRTAWRVLSRTGDYDVPHQLTVLDAVHDSLRVLSNVDIDTWATLQEATDGRALFQVPGGLLVFNLEEVETPFPQAYFATRGWPRDIHVEGDQILFAAGRYGIYSFDMDAFNLLSPLL
jgi:hypothetical protein